MADTGAPPPAGPDQPGSSPDAERPPSFEERLQELETLAERLKDGEVPLAESVELFERGMKLARSLGAELAKIERRIEIMINEPELTDTAPDLQLFPEAPFPETKADRPRDGEQEDIPF